MGEGADNVSDETSGPPTPRMRQLRQMLQRQPDDPFLLYGLAMEHKKAGEPGNALEYFDQVLRRDPNYCYAYYQRAQVHESLGDVEAARRTLREGVDAAKRSGDAHALSEIEAALALLE
jgi:Tfp pilus assembly protein PilF